MTTTETLNRPLVYYAVSLYIGCLSSVVLMDNKVLGAVLTASFLTSLFFILNKKNLIIVILFYFLGFISLFVYFRNYSGTDIMKFRVTRIEQYNTYGGYNGREIVLRNLPSNIKEGEVVLAKGSYKDNRDYSKGILGEFYIEKVLKRSEDFNSKLFKLKSDAYSSFENKLGEENASYVMSLCFGETKYLKEDQKNDFKKLGVIHAVSVSGFHIAVIYKLLENIFGVTASMIVSLIYVVFTGSQAATVRAFIMILILKLSTRFYKNYDGLSSLSLAAIVILVAKPYSALDLGFILSFLSTLGIIVYYKKILKVFYWLPVKIAESLSITLSAQIFSAPIVALSLKNISFGFILGNLVLLPIYTLIVITGNLLLLILKFKYIFGYASIVLDVLITAMKGAQISLLYISPPVSYLSSFDGYAMISLYICYILIKKGYKQWLYFPIVIIIVIMVKNYNFFPSIKYYAINAKLYAVVSYRGGNYLVAKERNNNTNEAAKKISERVVINDIFCLENKESISLNGKYAIKLICEGKDSASTKGMDLEVDISGKRTIITSSSKDYSDIDLYKYDIIKLPLKGRLSNTGGRGLEPFAEYKIFFHRLYAWDGD